MWLCACGCLCYRRRCVLLCWPVSQWPSPLVLRTSSQQQPYLRPTRIYPHPRTCIITRPLSHRYLPCSSLTATATWWSLTTTTTLATAPLLQPVPCWTWTHLCSMTTWWWSPTTTRSLWMMDSFLSESEIETFKKGSTLFCRHLMTAGDKRRLHFWWFPWNVRNKGQQILNLNSWKFCNNQERMQIFCAHNYVSTFGTCFRCWFLLTEKNN